MAEKIFPDGPGPLNFVNNKKEMRDGTSSGPAGLLAELTANGKTVHADFYNRFEDLYDDDDLDWTIA